MRRKLSPKKRKEIEAQLAAQFKKPKRQGMAAKLLKGDDVEKHLTKQFTEYSGKTEKEIDKRTKDAIASLNARIDAVLRYMQSVVQSKVDSMPEPQDGHTPTREEITAALLPLVDETKKEYEQRIAKIEQFLAQPVENDGLPKDVESLEAFVKSKIPKDLGGGSGPGYFFELFDTPQKVGGLRGAYRGYEGQFVKVSADGKSLEFGVGGGSGSTISVDGVEVTDPDFVDNGDINFTATGSDVSATIKDNSVGIDELSATGTPNNTRFLRGDNTWATPAGSGDMTKAEYDTNDDGVVDEAAVITNQGDLATLDTVNTAQIANGAVTEAKLSTSVNNSLDLADSSVQPGDNVSDLTNDSGYITDYTVTESDVTQHQAALSITESQITDLGSYITASSTDTLTNKSGSNSQWTNDEGYITDYTVTESDVTQHQAALSITESQITDLGSYIETTDVKNSVEIDLGDLQLVGDQASPGNNKVYGTDGSGNKGWKDDPAGGGGNYFNNVKIDSTDSDEYGTLSGTVNGTNTTFTVSAGTYETGTLEVYLNGKLVQNGAGNGWVESTPGSGTFDFVEAPVSGDVIVVRYQDQELSSDSVITDATTDVSGSSWVIDEDNMASDSATRVPTQQSVKAYVDAQSGGGGATELDDLSDVTLTTEADNDILQRKSGTFVNRTMAQLADDIQSELQITESQITDLGSYITDYTVTEADVTQHEAAIDHNALTNYSAAEHRTINDAATGATDLWSASKINSELSGKANTTHTHSASDITSGTFANARISESSVTQHEAALSVTESQISDLGSYIEASGVTFENLNTNGDVGTGASQVAAGDHTHTESDITDLGDYLEAGDNVMGTVVHGSTAGTARPSGFAVVTWVGSVEPTNATNNDVWIDTA